ncbi:patatin-like phospholipase family protein [Stigmatella sp. ncwal1]|uniref:Patatin-like phospholipase family protein n=1 Tax=Stigmatella ashevillensis TaxID=2995309 RepID=A0ABT5DLF2_9BACT|nr:patatin-like phospholipase family protein [Stigmatella ashevillena]MDC0714492.1 patatin-like phospholipase family protein [Stigmatella ashevillena]
MSRLKTGLVLGGGAARGAYEAGVLSYLREEFEPAFGRALKLDILAGTSVGAIHACYLAATNHQPLQQAQGLIAHWTAMKVEEVLRCGYGDIVRLLRETLGKAAAPNDIQHGGLVDPRGLRALVGRGIPWRNISRNLRGGHLDALAVSATHIGTGGATVFIQRHGGGVPTWSDDPNSQAVATRIGPNHALASAALPIVFPVVRIRGRLHMDGGLRLNVPLSPALRLGAQRVLIISLRSNPAEVQGEPQGPTVQEREQASVTAPFLIGQMLNMLMTDRIDQDLGRLRRLNAILEAGTSKYGPGFAQTLSAAVHPHRSQPVRAIRELLVRPSKDLGTLAAEYVRAPGFRKRSQGLAHRTILKLVEREAPRDADLASYLLFDGGFADILIDLGRQDARALRPQWERFWSEKPQSLAEEATLTLSEEASAA